MMSDMVLLTRVAVVVTGRPGDGVVPSIVEGSCPAGVVSST